MSFAAHTPGLSRRLIELAQELEAELDSGAKWTKAQHTCLSVSGVLRDLAASAPEPDIGLSGLQLRGLLQWAYSKLHCREFSSPGDALMLDAIKLELEHGQ